MKKNLIILFVLSLFVFNACENIDKNLATANKYKGNYQYSKAKEVYEEIIKKYPNSDKLNIAKENLQEIIILIEDEEINKLLKNAKNLIDTKEYSQANKIYETILQKYPNNKNIDKIKQAKEENDKLIFKLENPLGYGYNDAKWGMSKKEVKQVINKKIIEETKENILFGIKKGITLNCCFFDNKFYMAEYRIKDFSQNLIEYTTDGILATLLEKYGKESKVTTYISFGGLLQHPNTYVWEDNNTVIYFLQISYVGDYVDNRDKTITYYSKNLSKEKDDYDNNLELEKKKQKLQKEKAKTKKLDL